MSGLAVEPGRVVAGVDEAGLGPLVGPLTIGFSAFRLPRAGECPWQLLRRTCSVNPGSDRRKLAVADSKKVFLRTPRGRQRLERTALAFLAQGRPEALPPESADALLFGPVAPERSMVGRAPWYARLRPLPLEHERGSLELWAERLRRDMRDQSLELLDAGVRVVPACELNASYAETSNKALSVWNKTLEVLRHLWLRLGCESPFVTVDILGGRFHYSTLLKRGFPEARVSWSREQNGCSIYRLVERDEPHDRPARRMRLEFRARGEDHSFAVALASCLAKYTRELVMDAWNAFFCELDPDLRPTAGYYGDGTRWIRDAARALELSALERAVVVRER